MRLSDGFDTYNAGYVEEQYQRFLNSPGSVDEAWRRYFGGDGATANGTVLAAESPALSPQALRVAVAAAALVDAYRLHGHLIANLNPLDGGSGTARPTGRHVQLEPEFYGITLEDLVTLPAAALGFAGEGTAAGIVEWLKSVYAGPIGYEYEHIADAERREWLRDQIESGRYLQPLSADEKKKLLGRLTALEALEQFLHKAYLGQKRFSGEGTDLLVPILDVAIERAATAGAREVVIGMAHRGRLNVLAHILGVPYVRIVGEFEGVHPNNPGTGDVKYHMGGEGTYATASGQPLAVVLAPNPSHLEFVDAVVEGMVRAKQTNLHQPAGPRDEDAVLPVLIHGDAAFAGQGVVAETLNLMELDGFRTGGTLHVITNNQVGFTTNPMQARSTPYASDLAKGFDIPIFHVNADEPEACLAVARLAMEYRERFHTDVLIDLIGYRRYGHNEGDEPAYTQPRLYEKIAAHPTVRRLWADRLIQQGLLTEANVEAEWQTAYGKFVEAQTQVKASPKEQPAGNGHAAPAASPRVATGVAASRLLQLDREIHSWPADFNVNPKLARQLERRAKALPDGNAIDWAHAEALALASLLTEGVPVRMTGQDVERGTFSQRHLVLHDVKTGAEYTPMKHLGEAKAAFKLYNSPLSELAVVGFEYGYSVAESDTLVIWEAQFGDFANGAQVIIDQFISAGHAKWNQESRLVLLLPHGAEGQGPEHTSARLERFLQLAAEGEITVADCSTPAQYFHLLRRQVLSARRRPLVAMTPKSLLRHPKATSLMEDLVEGSFQPVLDDGEARGRAEQIHKAVLCTGKFYYDLVTSDLREKAQDTAILRVEELYPFPARPLAQLLGSYPALETVVWAQEEPQNMGAGPYMETHLPRVLPEGVQLGYAGRPERAAPAEGYASSYAKEQARVVQTVFAAVTDGKAAPKKAEVQKKR